MTLQHPQPADASFDGGDLDCGNGLLLLIRKHIDPLPPGGLLEVRSTEISVEEDLPAWCRLTGNPLVSMLRAGRQRSFLIAKGGPVPAASSAPASPRAAVTADLPQASPGVSLAALPPRAQTEPWPGLPWSVLGVGSWPRPRWLMQALHERLEGRLTEAEFEATADDAVRLCVQAQLAAGVDLVTDGEQRRDSYASFVGTKLTNCQLVPISDLLPYVEHPEEFEQELRALDVPAALVRHPAVFGPLSRRQPLALHEARFLAGLGPTPIKVALPGPYLLARTMWLDCLLERAYPTREALAADLVAILRAELAELLAAGVALVQFDEPVLSEVVYGRPATQRSFMCGALGERGAPAQELAFAAELLAAVTAGFPRERLALHVCRGNWTPDESAALSGDYGPLLPFLGAAPVGTLLLEACTPRAGDLELLRALPADKRLALGAVNPKTQSVEGVEDILRQARRAENLLGKDRLWLTSDCGFATFADNPVASAGLAQAKLTALAQAARRLRGG
jgi:5-methyltetrahydropteroyltriglutamate--homocysteine methyltransferase